MSGTFGKFPPKESGFRNPRRMGEECASAICAGHSQMGLYCTYALLGAMANGSRIQGASTRVQAQMTPGPGLPFRWFQLPRPLFRATRAGGPPNPCQIRSPGGVDLHGAGTLLTWVYRRQALGGEHVWPTCSDISSEGPSAQAADQRSLAPRLFMQPGSQAIPNWEYADVSIV